MKTMSLQESNNTESTKEAQSFTKKKLCETSWFSEKLRVITNTKHILLVLLLISFAGVKAQQVENTNSGICASVYCDGNGGVGIGTRKTNDFRLSVNGNIRASDIVKVYPQAQWPDFVFENNYQLSPLAEVEKFIKANGHLPGMPSAKEVKEEGVELSDMNTKLLQKIEETMLYLIELNKESEVLKKDNELIKTQLHSLMKNANNSNKK